MTLILALDFGGTKLAAALSEVGSREWLGYERRLSPAMGMLKRTCPSWTK